MKLFAHLRDTVTGDHGVCESEVEEQYLDNQAYLWGQGNYSCDCNRICFLAEVNPSWDKAVDIEPDCNSGPNRIALDRLVDESGNVLYKDEVPA